jgi:hypothetical protein
MKGCRMQRMWLHCIGRLALAHVPQLGDRVVADPQATRVHCLQRGHGVSAPVVHGAPWPAPGLRFLLPLAQREPGQGRWGRLGVLAMLLFVALSLWQLRR